MNNISGIYGDVPQKQGSVKLGIYGSKDLRKQLISRHRCRAKVDRRCVGREMREAAANMGHMIEKDK